MPCSVLSPKYEVFREQDTNAAFEKFLWALRTVCGTLVKHWEGNWQHGWCLLTSVCHAISRGAAKPSTRASGRVRCRAASSSESLISMGMAKETWAATEA